MAAIGIDQYQSWNALRNAVHDARGAYEAFRGLGFQEIRTPLFDSLATRDALHRLVQDELQRLRDDDSLVLFFAGHGHTISTPGAVDTRKNTGYLIPFDAKAGRGDRYPTETWILLSSWLTQLANLRARHILVILDSCFSGLALDPLARWSGERQLAMPLERLQQRTSRRVMASALEYQTATDGDHKGAHSRFTECLIEGLTGAIARQSKQSHITGTAIWSYIQTAFQNFTDIDQVPNFGAFEHHNDGDFVIPLADVPDAWRTDARDKAKPAHYPRGSLKALRTPPHHRPTSKQPEHPVRVVTGSSTPSAATVSLDALAQARLDLQQSKRTRNIPTMSVVVGEPAAARTEWARWAARNGRITLMTEETTLDGLTQDLLHQLPWVRCLPAARARFAAAAKIEVAELDARFAARSRMERSRWIGNIAGIDNHVRVSGWLLSALSEESALIPDLTTAPVQGTDLLAILCDLTTPLAIMVHHTSPSASWLNEALPPVAALARILASHPVGLCTPTALADQAIMSQGGGASMSMARQGRVDIGIASPKANTSAREQACQVLSNALNQDRRTENMFTLDSRAPTDEATRFTAVDLMGKTVRLAIQLDDTSIVEDLECYRRERTKDVWLQSAGFYVLRFLIEDIRHRLEAVTQEIIVCLGSRRSVRSTWETFHDQSV